MPLGSAKLVTMKRRPLLDIGAPIAAGTTTMVHTRCCCCSEKVQTEHFRSDNNRNNTNRYSGRVCKISTGGPISLNDVVGLSFGVPVVLAGLD